MLKKRDIKSDSERTHEKIKKLAGRKSGAIITGREKIELCACRGIMAYSDNLMVIRLCDGVIRVGGKELEIRNFYSGRMIITGNISGIEYSDR